MYRVRSFTLAAMHTYAASTKSAHKPKATPTRAKSGPTSESKPQASQPWGEMTTNVNQSSSAQTLRSDNGLVIQRKMTLGEAGDRYELEADRLAPQIVSQINTSDFGKPTLLSSHLQLKAPRPNLQLKNNGTEGTVSPEIESGIQRSLGQGRSLDSSLQKRLGHTMGADFSGVRVHTDTKANRLSRALNARAFTTGRNVFFNKGAYQPGSQQGQELIAHELTHVIQQQGAASISDKASHTHLDHNSLKNSKIAKNSGSGQVIQRTLAGKLADINSSQLFNGIKGYNQKGNIFLKYKDRENIFNRAGQHKEKLDCFEDVIITLFPEQSEAVEKAKKNKQTRLEQEAVEKKAKEDAAWYELNFPDNEKGIYYRGENTNGAKGRGGFKARSELGIDAAREEVKLWFGKRRNASAFEEHAMWVAKNKTLDGRRILIATGNDKDCAGYGVGTGRWVRQIDLPGLTEIEGRNITEDVLGEPVQTGVRVPPSLVMDSSTVDNASIIGVKGIGNYEHETTFFTSISLDKTKLIYRGRNNIEEPSGWLYGPNAIVNADQYIRDEDQ